LNQADCISEASQAQEKNDKLTPVGVVSVLEKQSDGLFHVERLFAQLSLIPLQL
jgi:hypothetical protein